MALTYVCSPLSAPTRAEMLANAAKASTYMMKAEQEFGNRAVAPHAYLPFLLDDTAPEERALALEFGQKLLAMCTRLVVYGDRISSGMSAERAGSFAEKCGEEFGKDAELTPMNIIDAKHFEVCTPEVTVKVDPKYSALISTRVIDGRRYILIPADGGVEVNGISVTIPEE